MKTNKKIISNTTALAENILQVAANDSDTNAAGLPATLAAGDWHEYNEVSDFKGMNIAPDYYLTDNINNIGKIYAGSDIGLRGFVRGQGGIYGLDLSHTPSEQNASIGFRCAK